MELNFPPNWDGPQPPRMTEERIKKILESVSDNSIARELIEEFIKMELTSFEINQSSYHRICGGGAMIMAPANGDKSNHKQYDLWCAKCGKLETVTLSGNHTITFS